MTRLNFVQANAFGANGFLYCATLVLGLVGKALLLERSGAEGVQAEHVGPTEYERHED